MENVRWAVLEAGRYQLAGRTKQWRIKRCKRVQAMGNECEDCRCAGTGLEMSGVTR